MALDHREIGKEEMNIRVGEANLWPVFKMKSGDVMVVVHRDMSVGIVQRLK